MNTDRVRTQIPRLYLMVASQKRGWQVARVWRPIVDGTAYEVPKGFDFDGASTPWRHPKDALMAACLHDRLYATGEVSRQRADEVFLTVMRVTGTQGRVRRWAMYGAVRAFGILPWRNHRRTD